MKNTPRGKISFIDLAICLVSTTNFIPVANAQSSMSPMPLASTTDNNGVDVINWPFSYYVAPISIGPEDQNPIKVSIYLPTERDSFSSNLRIQDPSGVNSRRVSASIGPQSWSFIDGVGASDPGSSVTIAYYGAGNTVAEVHTRDGTIVAFDTPAWLSEGSVGPINLCAAKITRLNGEVLTFYNDYYLDSCRTLSIVSNRGYQIKYEYPASGWTDHRSKIVLINNAYEYCNPTALTCSLSMSWPSVQLSFVSGTHTYTTGSGKTWEWGSSGIKQPGQTAAAISWTSQTYYPVNGYLGEIDWRITSATRNGQTWNYSYPSSDALLGGVAGQLLRVEDPLGNVRRYRRAWAASGGDPNTGGEYESPSALTKFADEAGNVTTYSYNSQYLLTEVAFPEGNKQVATYDGAGNILTHTLKAKPGSGIADATTTYVYAGCCNDKPTSVTDAMGNTTDYTYDSVHGGILTESGPAPSAGAPRPVKRYAYSQHYAWVKNSGGSYVQAATPIWLLDSEKTCSTSATVSGACAGGSADEVTITYDYGPNSGPNNLWLRGKVVTAGGVSLRTCYTYDAIGNKISETSARAGLAACS